MRILTFTDNEMLRKLMIEFHESSVEQERRSMNTATTRTHREFCRGRLEAHRNMVDYWQHIHFSFDAIAVKLPIEKK